MSLFRDGGVAMIEVPNEIWMHIASFTERQDLIRLALVSWLHLAIVRSILAEKITLHDRAWLDHNRNLSFLAETGLSKRIRSLSIFDFKKNDMPDIPFASMPNLETLRFGNCGAWSGNRQKAALQSLRQSCTGLRSITVNSPCSVFPRGTFSIPSVVAVNWNEGGYFTPSLFSLCKSSLSTIQHLRIWLTSTFVPDSEARLDGIRTRIRFFRLRFPSLLSLEIGPGDPENQSDNANYAFTKFLVAHPTLEKLVLPHRQIPGTHNHDVSLRISPIALVPANTLPVLRYFEAHPRSILQLLTVDAHFLTTKVETLYIAEACHVVHSAGFYRRNLAQMLNGVDNVTIPLLSILGRIRSTSQHPAQIFPVKHLVLDLSSLIVCDQPAVALVSDALMAAAACFPGLESWVGSIPVIPSNLPRLFSKFPRVQSIAGKLAGQKSIDEASVLKLAESCKHLRRVDCLTADKSFIIERQGSGDDERINIRMEDRPDFDEDSPAFRFTWLDRVIGDHYFPGVDDNSDDDDDDYLGSSDADSNYFSNISDGNTSDWSTVIDSDTDSN